MKLREATILCLVLALGLGAYVMFGTGDDGGAPPPNGAPDQDPSPLTNVDPSRTDANEPSADPSPNTGGTSTDPGERPMRELPPDAEFGVIDGEVFIRGDQIDLLADYTVLVEELVHDPTGTEKPRQHRKIVTVNPDGPQLFTIDNVVFSDRGYRVQVFADGMNGSSTIVAITRRTPVANAALTLMQAGPFTLRLTDQYNNALEGKQVELRPTPPLGRRNVFAETDGYGSAVFSVLVAGDYEVWIDQSYRETITVLPVLGGRDPSRAGAGSTLLQLPVGSNLEIEIADRINNPVRGVSVELRKIDTRDRRGDERTTDGLGHALFEHLEPGPYRVEVRGESIRPTFRRIDVLPPDESALETQRVQIRVAPR